jgi:hypothetical protein
MFVFLATEGTEFTEDGVGDFFVVLLTFWILGKFFVFRFGAQSVTASQNPLRGELGKEQRLEPGATFKLVWRCGLTGDSFTSKQV